jgi:pyrroloquinoline quinone (PQQ) biosynthesis protein C
LYFGFATIFNRRIALLSERLIKESADQLEHFGTLPFITAVRNGSVTKDRYMQFLNDLYHVVWNFCPVMAAGASRCNEDYSTVRYAIYEHIHEEKGHEEWVLSDCQAVGGDEFEHQVRNGKPRPEIQAMAAFNYYVAERQHGTAALAMVFALELISQRLGGRVSAGVAKALNLEGTHGTTFLSSHGTMDEGHLKEMSRAIDSIADPAVGEIMANAVAVNFALFAAMLS